MVEVDEAPFASCRKVLRLPSCALLSNCSSLLSCLVARVTQVIEPLGGEAWVMRQAPPSGKRIVTLLESIRRIACQRAAALDRTGTRPVPLLAIARVAQRP
jgi:hypothetical protein